MSAARSPSIEFSSQTEFLQHVTQLDLQRVEISQRIAAVAIIAFPEICFQVFLPVRVARNALQHIIPESNLVGAEPLRSPQSAPCIERSGDALFFPRWD